jgi:hypothetical protein
MPATSLVSRDDAANVFRHDDERRKTEFNCRAACCTSVIANKPHLFLVNDNVLACES